MAFGLSDKINDLHGKAVMGRAEWEVLLLQKQVISKVCRACTQGLDSRPTSKTTSTVLMCLAALLRTALADLINADATGSGASNTDLHVALCNQLTRSGLLQQLPGAMQAAARLLAETAAQHNLSSSNGSTSNTACGSCAHSSSTSSSCSSDGPSMPALSHVLLQARAVLDVYNVLHDVWPTEPLGEAAKLMLLAPAAALALELVMASVHAVDQLLQQQQTPLPVGDDLVAAHLMLPSVQQYVLQLVLNPDYRQTGQSRYADTAAGRAVLEAVLSMQAAKRSSKYLYCLSYCILVLSIASMPALQQLAADQQAAGSAEAPLDEVAVSLLQHASSMQQCGLHPSQQQLGALLGLKPRSALWAAAAAVVPTAISGPLPQDRILTLMATFLGAHKRLNYHLYNFATPQQLQTWMQQQQHWECDLGLLQCGVCTGLQWAASLPHQHSPSWCTAISAVAAAAAAVSDSAVLAWAAVEEASLLQGPTGSDRLPATGRLAVLQQQHSQWTDCLLLPALQLSAVMCQHTQQLLLSGSSGSGSTAGSSNGGQNLHRAAEVPCDLATVTTVSMLLGVVEPGQHGLECVGS